MFLLAKKQDTGLRSMMAELFELEAGEVDASAEYMRFQTEKLLRKFFRFELLDEVFGKFLETNLNKWSLEQILTFRAGVYPGDRTYSTFFHAEIPYMATVFLFSKNGEEWVNVKLNNDGFWYDRIHGEQFISRHNHDKWIRLGIKYHKYFTVLRDAFRETHKILIYYNAHLKRVDVKLFSLDTTLHKNVVVTFEPGYPDFEYEEDKNAFLIE